MLCCVAEERSLEDGLSRLVLAVALYCLLLLLPYHLLLHLWVLLKGLCLFPSLASGLHPGNKTQHGAPDHGRDACQVEGHIIAAQTVPEEACKHQRQQSVGLLLTLKKLYLLASQSKKKELHFLSVSSWFFSSNFFIED